MTQVESFLESLKNIDFKGNTPTKDPISKDHLNECLQSIIDLLPKFEEQINNRQMNDFYEGINQLKYLIEYSDGLNKNWYLIRACSGALRRLLRDTSIQNTTNVYSYYETKYGRRRILRHENWFEQQRWEFLDDLKTIDQEEKLNRFLDKSMKQLNEYFQTYKNELLLFIEEVKTISHP